MFFRRVLCWHRRWFSRWGTGDDLCFAQVHVAIGSQQVDPDTEHPGLFGQIELTLSTVFRLDDKKRMPVQEADGGSLRRRVGAGGW